MASFFDPNVHRYSSSHFAPENFLHFTKNSFLSETYSDENRPSNDFLRPESDVRSRFEVNASWWYKYFASKAKMVIKYKEKILEIECDACFSQTEIGRNAVRRCGSVDRRISLRPKSNESNQRSIIRSTQIRRFARQKWSSFFLVFVSTRRQVFIDGFQSNKSSSSNVQLESFDVDRLKELSRLETFQVFLLSRNLSFVCRLFSLFQLFDTELENVGHYEHFNDCLDTFPLFSRRETLFYFDTDRTSLFLLGSVTTDRIDMIGSSTRKHFTPNSKFVRFASSSQILSAWKSVSIRCVAFLSGKNPDRRTRRESTDWRWHAFVELVEPTIS